MLACVLPGSLARDREEVLRFSGFLPSSLLGHGRHGWRAIQNPIRFAVGSYSLFNRS